MRLQETNQVSEKSREIEHTAYKLWYTGKDTNINGARIKVRRITDKIQLIQLIKFLLGQDTNIIVSAYAPQMGLEESIKPKFWEDMNKLIQELPKQGKDFYWTRPQWSCLRREWRVFEEFMKAKDID